MSLFSLNLRGKIKNVPAFSSTPLLPIYEAVVNSLQAIFERQRSESNFIDGRIDINVMRIPQITTNKEIIPDIIGFEIKDNGVGFNIQNINSFFESDSSYKQNIGGKGVGRFSWLKAFDKAEISSNYLEDGTFKKIEFVFSQEMDNTKPLPKKSPDSKHETVIKLEGYNLDYEYSKLICRKKTDAIARDIMQHCLVYFMDKKCPTIFVNDKYAEPESINLNTLFKEIIQKDENIRYFKIKDYEFELLHIKITDKIFKDNYLYLCADNRLVKIESLKKHIIDLNSEIFKKEGFWYLGILTGKYLDRKVDMSRLSFTMPKKDSNLLDELTFEEIINESCIHIKKYLETYLNKIKEEKIINIQNYISNKAPQYKYLLKHCHKQIINIEPNLEDEKLDDALHKIQRDFEKESKCKEKEILYYLEKNKKSFETYEKLVKEYLERINDTNASKLVEYTIHRKAIIELFKIGLRKKDDEKFNKEQYMHDLIYPMKSTSEETGYASHNLWLIDERLAYCNYISSDIPFKDIKQRPDILILDKPVVMSDSKNDGTPFESVIIFELKRPMRDDYSHKENPITQLYEYVRILRKGETIDKYGRYINVDSSTKYYLYAVCDITSSLKKFIEEKDFKKTLDNQGYYNFNSSYNAYFEILSYDKILKDAQKRNRVLFDKLGIL